MKVHGVAVAVEMSRSDRTREKEREGWRRSCGVVQRGKGFLFV